MVLAAACGPAGPVSGALPFSTIEQKNDAAYIGQQQYNALDPGVMVFWDAESAGQSDFWFSEAARQQLARVDWRTQFVVVVFQGWQGGGGYGVTIETIRLTGSAVRIQADFNTPAGGPAGSVTSPYHLVAIRRPLQPVPVEVVVGDEPIQLIASPTPPP